MSTNPQSQNQTEIKPLDRLINRLPRRLQNPLIYILGLILLLIPCLTIITLFQDAFINDVPPTPTLTVTIATHRAEHVVNEDYFLGICAYDTYLVHNQYLSEIESATDDDRLQKVLDYGVAIVPAVLHFNVFQEAHNTIDQLAIINLKLVIDSYTPITDPTTIILATGTCASQHYPAIIQRLVLPPREGVIDVLNPRVTSPSVSSISIPQATGLPEGISIYVNSHDPGIYTLSMIAEYVLNGKTYSTQPMKFKVAVPAPNYVNNVISVDWWPGGIGGPYETMPYLVEWYKASFVNNLDMNFFKNGEASEGMSGQYTYIVNLGNDVNLTGWSLYTKDSMQYFSFPDGFILLSGNGVRVWNSVGTNTNKDLFGALEVDYQISSDYYIVELRDQTGTRIASAWVNRDEK